MAEPTNKNADGGKQGDAKAAPKRVVTDLSKFDLKPASQMGWSVNDGSDDRPKDGVNPEVWPKATPVAKPASYAKGGKVKKTGLALVHEGEVIVPKDRAAHAMGGGKKSSKKSSKKSKKSKVHKMHIRRTANGGFLAEHHSTPDEAGQTPPMEEHSLPDIQSLQDHVGEHMGPQEEGGEEQAAAPQAAAPAMA